MSELVFRPARLADAIYRRILRQRVFGKITVVSVEGFDKNNNLVVNCVCRCDPSRVYRTTANNLLRRKCGTKSCRRCWHAHYIDPDTGVDWSKSCLVCKFNSTVKHGHSFESFWDFRDYIRELYPQLTPTSKVTLARIQTGQRKFEKGNICVFPVKE